MSDRLDPHSDALMQAYQTEMQYLQDELLLLSRHEPRDEITMAHVHWEERLEMLERQIDDVQDRIDELEEQIPK